MEDASSHLQWVQAPIQLISYKYGDMTDEEKLAWAQTRSSMTRWIETIDEQEDDLKQQLWKFSLRKERERIHQDLDLALYDSVSAARKRQWEHVAKVLAWPISVINIPTLKEIESAHISEE